MNRHTPPPPSPSPQAMDKYAESMKDLKQLLELDNENSVAKTEFSAVKQMWEKQLRQLQEKNEKVKGNKPSPGKKKSSSGHKQKASSRDKTRQQQELAQLLVETKNKVKEMKRGDLSFTEKPSEYLNASKTTYYKPTHTQQESSTAGTSRRRKVVIEEEGEEGEQAPGKKVLDTKTTAACEDQSQPTKKADSHEAMEEREDPKEEEEGREQLLETGTRSSEDVVQSVLQEEEGTADVTLPLSENRAESTGKEAEERVVKDAQLVSCW